MPSGGWLNEVQLRAWISFLESSRMLEEQVAQQLRRDEGMTHLEYEVLVRLEWAPEHRLRMADLAAKVIASRPRLTYVVDQLEKRGWVSRQPVPDDARGFNAVLTPAGLSALAEAAHGHVDAVRDGMFSCLSTEQTTQLAEIMETLRSHLRQRRGQH